MNLYDYLTFIVNSNHHPIIQNNVSYLTKFKYTSVEPVRDNKHDFLLLR